MKGLPVVAILLTGLHYVQSLVSHCQSSATFTPFSQLPVSTSRYRSLLINADDVNDIATFMDDSTTVGERTISFGQGTSLEKLLEIPLADAGELDPQNTIIRVTVALKPPSVTTDHDPVIGISDGSNENRMALLDGAQSVACIPRDAGLGDDNLRPTPHPVPYFYTLIFRPLTRYGACETAQKQLGGYVNTMTFNPQVDITNGLNFVLYRDSASEQYTFYYFLVEILQ